MTWPFRRRLRRSRDPGSRVVAGVRWIGRILRWSFRLLLVFIIVDLFYVATQWPDWDALQKGSIPKSNFILSYQRDLKKPRHKNLPPLRWRPVSYDKIPQHMIRAVVVAEDSRFYQHDGFDLIAFREAMDQNLSRGKLAFGASTISQQTVKNLFLTGSRDFLRKWHELLLTWGMERNLKKRRIMELYLNIAEFGKGIYGVEAASLHYWNKPVSQVTWRQAAELAACLPSPKKHNPTTRTPAFERRVDKIYYWLMQNQNGT
ncbi:MAG: monofunctional biosynthetic peptidoglycan transglycosylase [Gammaproteobacteria bacterium]|nr:monofunctional biosynthetic peptidoglycan transglycosylase [Gammaproteobacteria bacterium]